MYWANVLDRGGYTEYSKVAHLAEMFHLPLANGGGWYLQNGQLIAGVSNGWLVEFHLLREPIYEAVYLNPNIHLAPFFGSTPEAIISCRYPPRFSRASRFLPGFPPTAPCICCICSGRRSAPRKPSAHLPARRSGGERRRRLRFLFLQIVLGRSHGPVPIRHGLPRPNSIHQRQLLSPGQVEPDSGQSVSTL